MEGQPQSWPNPLAPATPARQAVDAAPSLARAPVVLHRGARDRWGVSLFYRLAYRLGFTPWEEAADHPAASEHIHALFDREITRRGDPPGRALDIGCGRGIWTIELARRGWDVTGVDNVPAAVARARARIAAAGVRADVVRGDITSLRSAIDGRFDLFWDFGAIHGLGAAQQRAAGAEIDALAAPGAALLLLAWTPARRGPLPRGMSRDDVLAMLPGWRITDEESFDATGLPAPLRRVAPRMYRIARP